MENKRYTIAQAIELLNQGKRITHELWGCSYIYKNSEGVVMAHAGSFKEIPNQRYDFSLNDLKELYNDDLCFFCLDGDLEAKEESPQPCCICGLNDHWNSKNKNSKWVCYKHC